MGEYTSVNAKKEEMQTNHTQPPKASRTTGFLLGLVFILACMYVAFEYNVYPENNDWDSEMINEVLQEIDLQPLVSPKEQDYQPLMSAQKRLEPVLTPHIEISKKPLTNPPQALDTQQEGMDEPNSGVALSAESSQDHATKKHTTLSQTIYQQPQDKVLRIVDQMPEFPGGASAFIQWLNKSLVYPASCLSNKIEGKVVISFIVNIDGSISELKIEQPAHEILNNEALRVMQEMPNWKPGLHHNQPCRTMVAVPIVFDI